LVKVVITGGSGLLGSNLSAMYSSNHEVYFTYNTHPVKIKGCTAVKADITVSIEEIKKLEPDLIIHCAAMTDVDKCETDREAASKVNVFGTENVVRAAEYLGCRLIHISTDAVFDGKKGMYTESDRPNPANYYGKTKLDAEKIVSKLKDSVIVRTNIYGWNLLPKQSLAEWMIEKLRKKEALPAIKDIYTTPMLVNNLGRALEEIYEKDKRGIYNVAGSERASKLEFANAIAKVFSLNGKLIKPISSKELKFKAPRGADISLDTSKARKELSTELLGLESGLAEMKRLEDSGFASALKKGL
jgi:dTDP-4-dehydrorhamnose reductase